MKKNTQFAKFVLFAISILFISCSKQVSIMEEPIEEIVTVVNDSISYLALGDSYTIGQGVQASKRWPNQLIDKLEENNIVIGKPRILAQTGWTTRNLINAIESADLSNLKDEVLVSLLIGVNNQYQNLAFENFKTEIDIIINKSIQIAGTSERVFVVSIPDYGVTPFGGNNSDQIGQEIDLYNEYMSNKCDVFNIPFINITEISRELADSKNALAPDKLHPSGYQYEKWVNEILPVVLEIVTE